MQAAIRMSRLFVAASNGNQPSPPPVPPRRPTTTFLQALLRALSAWTT